MEIEGLTNELTTGIRKVSEFISGHPTEVALGTAGVGAAGAGLVAFGLTRHKKKAKRKTHKKTKKAYRRTRRKLKFGSKAYRRKYLGKRRKRQKYPYTARKRKDTSHRRIRYTKNNQPYVILVDGKARFISKKSVRGYRRRKGGRY